MTKRAKLWLLGAASGTVLALGLIYGRQKSGRYPLSVEQALDRQSSADVVWVRGNLRPESLCKVVGQCAYRWYLEDSDHAAAQPQPTLEVRYDGCKLAEFMQLDLPPGFDVEVAVKGTLATGARLLATEALAKSPPIAPGDPIWDSRRPLLDCD